MKTIRRTVNFLESVLYGEKRSALARLVNVLLIGSSYVYRSAVRIYLFPFDIGLRKKRRLSRPVISVGNITVGGTGKTPMVRHICQMLLSAGLRPAVLSYGYGGSLRGRFGIVSDGSDVLLSHLECGDEPAMLAKSLPGVPVLVGKDRVRTGQVAINELGANVLVLDDGFQVWKLHRDLDLVLLRADCPFDNYRTLPAGRLREPMTAISHADCLILTGNPDAELRERALEAVRRCAPELPVWFARFEPSSLIPLSGAPREPLDTLHGRRVFALCAIANPDSFEQTLQEAGAEIVGTARFPDHHEYSEDDVVEVSANASEHRADWIVTTEKDAVKLSRFRFRLPIYTLHIEIILEGDKGFQEFVASRIALPTEDTCL